MYYSKTQAQGINIPHNYSGNTFRATEENYTDNNEKALQFESEELVADAVQNYSENEEKGAGAVPFLSHILSNVSIEDFLILGLIIVIHQENPNDTTLLLLLILLLAK